MKTTEAVSAQSAEAAFIGIARVRQLTGLSKSTIARRIAEKRFPLPVLQEKDCDGRVYLTRWDLGEILEWRRQQFAKRDERLNADSCKVAA
jgi:predicted DNA-binding transcriptional regulator AlpA